MRRTLHGACALGLALGACTGSGGESESQARVGTLPDLVITRIDGPSVIAPGSSVTITSRVCNQGAVGAPPSWVLFALSLDATIELTDPSFGARAVPPLQPGQCHAESGLFWVSSGGPGTEYYLGGLVDADQTIAEDDEGNNSLSMGPVGYGNGPDLVVGAIDAPPSIDGPFTAVARICNRGNAAASGASVSLYLTEDELITPGPGPDVLLGSTWVSWVGPSACADVVIDAFTPPVIGAYYLGALVDEFDAVLELVEGNNELVGPRVGVGNGPDLVVRSLRAPPSAQGAFRVDVELCNQGTSGGDAGWSSVYVSADAVIDPGTPPGSGDLFLGSAYAGFLAPGQCRQSSVDAYNPGLQGAYYLGAIADEYDFTPELIEDNNTFTGALTGFGSGPDLLVESIAGPSSASGEFTAQIRACNRGTAPISGAQVDLYASADQELVTQQESPFLEDFFLGSAFLPGLQPGECRSQSLTAWPPPGGPSAYYLAAAADPFGSWPELIESNNEAIGPLTGFGFGSDLVVESIAGPPSANGPFTVRTRGCNRGTAHSNGVSLDIYSSLDTTITPFFPFPSPDQFLGSRWLPPLPPGACHTEDTQVYAPPFTGAQYLGAVVDPANSDLELIESNNTTLGALTGFGSGPDFVVQSVSGPPSADGPFSVTVRVCNQGTAWGSPGTTEVYLSSDTIIERFQPGGAGDHFIGAAFFSGLEPGRCASQTLDVFPPPLNGPHYLGAIVDPYLGVPELIEVNNTLAGALIGLGSGPDLVVRALTGPASASGELLLRFTVCNQGTAPASSAQLSLYASADTELRGIFPPTFDPDPLLNMASLPFLQPGQCHSDSVQAWNPGLQGAYYLVAAADENGFLPELIETNNQLFGGLIGLGNGPDLVVTELGFPPSALGTFPLSVRLCNQGTQWSNGGDVQLFASTDTELQPPPGPTADFPLGAVFAAGLAPGRCQNLTTDVSAPLQGAVHLIAQADPFGGEAELIESNNVLIAGPMGLGSGPDLVVRSLSAPPSANGPFVISARVCNQGTTGAQTVVSVYASEDQVLEPGPGGGDYYLGDGFSNHLNPGQCQDLTLNAFAPGVQGAYHLLAIADSFNGVPELLEGNNQLVGGLIGFGSGPDLVVTAVSGPFSANGMFSLSNTVCNQGTAPAGGFSVTLLASADTTLVGLGNPPWAQDLFLGSRFVSGLAPGQCDTVATDAYWPGVQGAYHLGALVDDPSSVLELIESNNAGVGAQIGFGNGPDLVVTAVSGPPSASGQFAVATTVCNRGTQASQSTNVNLYVSDDPLLEPSLFNPGSGDRFLGSRFVPSLAPGVCDSGNADAWVGGEQGAYYLAATVDEGGPNAELNEGNNQRVGGLIGLGNGPDLVLGTLVADPFSLPGGPIDVLLTICNQGTAQAGPASVAIYASRDTVIESGPPGSSGDFLINWAATNSIGPGQCESLAVSGPMPPELGTYHVGVSIDDNGSVPELIESNNRAVGDQTVVDPVFCGNGSVDPGEQCDDGNFSSGDGCSDACFAEHRVWQENANGTLRTNVAWNYAMGYHFTPQVNGLITELGGFFNGSKRVRLYNRGTGALLAEAVVTAANTWGYTAITPVQVDANVQYTVAVYLAGTGGSYRSPLAQTLPRTYGDVRITGSTYVYTAGTAGNARPTNSVSTVMYGQADVKFVRRP